jgi:hypothetical protein
MGDHGFVVSHPFAGSRERMGQRLLVVNDQDDAMLCHRTTAHLASPMRAVDDLCPKLDANLAFVSYVLPLADVFVKHDIPLLAVDDYARRFYPNYEPLLQITARGFGLDAPKTTPTVPVLSGVEGSLALGDRGPPQTSTAGNKPPRSRPARPDVHSAPNSPQNFSPAVLHIISPSRRTLFP